MGRSAQLFVRAPAQSSCGGVSAAAICGRRGDQGPGVLEGCHWRPET
ncbi:MAG: hypothetical protein QN152_07485 [Armatimonadota bacterium]|nr:hypothetical protein [Armatimonadota bacterium]MDR7426391.1 hypothetical protein [Armatimonadota bacterium]MDR7463963.1 hypothetical protein [Armatimonadota bacterium]MDR7469522.1 hypothetical protein [Armatimonadota bacterium]MDR7473470.1 hypothetical protein [Armatimonadota bacterium]